jgi:hypothetical protein
MSTINSKNVQVGTSGVANQNFTLYQPNTPDGTVRLGVGNSGVTTSDVVTVTNAGNMTVSGVVTATTLSGAGSFTTLSASSTVSGTGFSTYLASPPAIGGTAAAAGSFTTVSASGNMSFNSGYGSAAVAYGCRAWVNFNGVGTIAIRGSGNVSSITDGGVGAYTVNFTTALADANYAGVVMTGTYQALASNDAAAPTTTAFAFISRQSNSPATSLDSPYLHVAIFR